ncbi:MAG: TolC family protein [Bacteroidales bacterium]|nr:TolC family protein [Bacteroidales bacterium]
MMKRLYISFLTLAMMAHCASAQSPWTMDQCMAYAVEHSTGVAKAEWALSTSKAEVQSATAAFLPSVSASSSAQVSWGRNIDPETNTYNTLSTFYNTYGAYASLTLFDGGQTINRWKQARIDRQKSQTTVEATRDDKAIEVMMAFVDAVYCNGAVACAQEKRENSAATLRKTEMQEELGIKGFPDVAQARAQYASDDYTLVQQRNLYDMACLKLWSAMNLPMGEKIQCDTSMQALRPELQLDDIGAIYDFASTANPKALDAELAVKSAKLDYRIAQGALMPSIYVSGGVSTTYYKMLTHGNQGESFGTQFKNNLGEYIGASISIPLFSNLSKSTARRRARNNWEIAKLERDETLRQLYTDIAQAVKDRDGYALEIISLIEKVEADSLAYSLNQRKYDEGLLSLIDLQTTANTLYRSRIDLLQRRMLYVLKQRLVDYYKGMPLYNETGTTDLHRFSQIP